jgi:hypothetical protein
VSEACSPLQAPSSCRTKCRKRSLQNVNNSSVWKTYIAASAENTISAPSRSEPQMATTHGPARCSGCDALLSAEFCRSERIPCPHCGWTARTFGVGIETTAAVLPILKLLGLRARMSRTKGWFVRIFEGLVPQRSRGGVLARVERRLDRDPESAWYAETVTMHETGEVIHHCSEPLSQHRDHGSVKAKRGR